MAESSLACLTESDVAACLLRAAQQRARMRRGLEGGSGGGGENFQARCPSCRQVLRYHLGGSNLSICQMHMLLLYCFDK